MYTITLEVNQICNLRCTYCYLGDKTNAVMLESTAHEALKIAFINTEKHKDRKLWVDFVGGEALISFEFLQNLTDFINNEALKRKIQVSYSMTTNGSIMNTEIMKWIIENKIQIKLSIDGIEEIHNKNRRTITGKGSYSRIIENIDMFKECEQNTKRWIQVAHVITQNNYYAAFQSVKHLYEDLKFNVIDSSIDVTSQWSKKQLDLLTAEWEKVLLYSIEMQKSERPFLWGVILDLLKYKGGNEKNNFCGVGLIQSYVKTNGKIYGCAANLGETGCIGDVKKGFFISRIEELKKVINSNGKCQNCKIFKQCQNRKCIMNILAYDREDMCYFEYKKLTLWAKYESEILS